MKIALIGLPQAGKRTLFTLLTGRTVPESRKPGEVIEGVAPIRDPRVDRIAGVCKPDRVVYAENHFALCPDVVEGAGAREWMDAARKCDLLCFVVRAFASDSVYHPKGGVDPARDRTLIEGELMLADMEMVEKRLARLGKEKRAGFTPEQQAEERALQACMAAMERGAPLHAAGLEDADRAAVRNLCLLTLIPQLCCYNVGDNEVAREFGGDSVTISAQIEREIAGMENPAERADFLAALGLDQPGVDRMNAATYRALGLMSFYTMGKDEARAWTIRRGATAPAAAGRIHSDIERGFIRAEVIKYDDLMAFGSEKAVKDHGKVLLKGKDYIMEDGDICHFLFNV